MHDSDEPQNPIVAMAMKLRSRRDLGAAIDSAMLPGASPNAPGSPPANATSDAETLFAQLADVLADGTKKLNSILGVRTGVTFVRLEKPLRLRLRFREARISLDLDRAQQLVVVKGCELDGDYQFDTSAAVPALINLSKLSTEAGYGAALTGSTLLKTISADAEIPRPAHLDANGPMSFEAAPNPRTRPSS
jgi:hypothetical protein